MPAINSKFKKLLNYVKSAKHGSYTSQGSTTVTHDIAHDNLELPEDGISAARERELMMEQSAAHDNLELLENGTSAAKWPKLTMEQSASLIIEELETVLKNVEGNPAAGATRTTSSATHIQMKHWMTKFQDDLVVWKANYKTDSDELKFRTSVNELENIILNASGMIDEINEMISLLATVLKNDKKYTKLLEQSKGTPQAQLLIDFLQWLLDTNSLDKSLRNDLIVAAQRLCRDNKVYPKCYLLKNIVNINNNSNETKPFGSYATVYKGEYHGHSAVALKVLKSTGDTVRRFWKDMQEGLLWGQLSHPHLLPIFGVYLLEVGESHLPCFVSPWQHNGHVITYLANNLNNPKVNRMRLAFEIASGLAYLAENNIVHGDLKGNNVLVDAQGTALLADFGLSSIYDPTIVPLSAYSSLQFTGAHKWWAPELFDYDRKNKELGRKSYASDVYAWSLVCFEMYTGQAFLHELSDDEAQTRICAGIRPIKPEEESQARRCGLTNAMWTLMESAWDKEREKRPTAEKLVTELAAFLGGDVEQPNKPNTDRRVHFRERMKGALDIEYVDLLLETLKEIEADKAPGDALSGILENLSVDEASENIGEGPSK